jgi:hypothetical protein
MPGEPHQWTVKGYPPGATIAFGPGTDHEEIPLECTVCGAKKLRGEATDSTCPGPASTPKRPVTADRIEYRHLDLSSLDQAFQMKVLRFMEAVAKGDPVALALVEEHEYMIAEGTN